ncbi:hypothetical protein GOBAR_DD03553 [Gossypium barbadense]|nr:hypothetical protein GOBAR_DD03553 [Gossypium barbadense]
MGTMAQINLNLITQYSLTKRESENPSITALQPLQQWPPHTATHASVRSPPYLHKKRKYLESPQAPITRDLVWSLKIEPKKGVWFSYFGFRAEKSHILRAGSDTGLETHFSSAPATACGGATAVQTMVDGRAQNRKRGS